MSKGLWLACVVLAVTAPCSAEIFKCTAKSGLPLYQNFPCEFDSLASLPGGPQTAALVAVPVHAEVKDPAAASTSTPRSRPGVPSAGMTENEVRTLWGEPQEVIQDEPRSGRVEIWRYVDGRVVQINQKRRVISVQW